MRKLYAVLIVGFTVACTYSTTYYLSAPKESENDVILIDFNSTEELIDYNNTYCTTFHGKENERGPRQLVVSYAFYESVDNKRPYFKGIEANVKLIGQYYPGWIMRVYHNATPDTKTYSVLEELEKRYENLDFCNILNITDLGNVAASFGMVWRFIPMADPSVDIFLSRDLDSLIYPREVAAVQEWLDTNYTFHIMRDNPWHSWPIMGGMWGARVANRRPILSQLIHVIIANAVKGNKYGLDQNILTKTVWPYTDGDGIHHDSYHCTDAKLQHKYIKPFPTRRDDGNFVGSTGPTINKTCPVACRRKPEWTIC